MITEQEPDINYENARRAHHEYYAPALVNHWWMRLFCAGLIVALMLNGLAAMKNAKQLKRQGVIVLTPAQDGNLDRVQYVNMENYRPDQKVIEHFVYIWAVKYYSRIRASIADDYPESLQFFAPEMVAQELHGGGMRQTEWIQTFRDDTSLPEIRVQVQKIRMEKGGIAVDFERHYWMGGREIAGKTEEWTSQFPYTVMPVAQVANGMIPINPIGLQITARPVETKGF